MAFPLLTSVAGSCIGPAKSAAQASAQRGSALSLGQALLVLPAGDGESLSVCVSVGAGQALDVLADQAQENNKAPGQDRQHKGKADC